jgi:hypothetical protein
MPELSKLKIAKTQEQKIPGTPNIENTWNLKQLREFKTPKDC